MLKTRSIRYLTLDSQKTLAGFVSFLTILRLDLILFWFPFAFYFMKPLVCLKTAGLDFSTTQNNNTLILKKSSVVLASVSGQDHQILLHVCPKKFVFEYWSGQFSFRQLCKACLKYRSCQFQFSVMYMYVHVFLFKWLKFFFTSLLKARKQIYLLLNKRSS